MSKMNKNMHRFDQTKPFVSVLANRCGHILPITSILWTNQFLEPGNQKEIFHITLFFLSRVNGICMVHSRLAALTLNIKEQADATRPATAFIHTASIYYGKYLLSLANLNIEKKKITIWKNVQFPLISC